MPVTPVTTDPPGVLLRPDNGFGFVELHQRTYDRGLQSLRMKAMLGERADSDVLLYEILKQMGAFPEED